MGMRGEACGGSPPTHPGGLNQDGVVLYGTTLSWQAGEQVQERACYDMDDLSGYVHHQEGLRVAKAIQGTARFTSDLRGSSPLTSTSGSTKAFSGWPHTAVSLTNMYRRSASVKQLTSSTTAPARQGAHRGASLVPSWGTVGQIRGPPPPTQWP